MQGWVWGLFGLGIGLSVSAVIYLNNRPPAGTMTEAVADPSPPARVAAGTDRAQPPDETPRFTFYDMLPNFEVVIPEEELAAMPAAPAAAVEKPGVYVLQAGSFSRYEDADRRKAELAMLGVETGIQKVTVDDKVYHRVRIGPVDNLDRLNELRRQLRGVKIDAMVIRVGE
ncbi:MAG: SPOR domain-containing protein [Gammaproteobacteria bacterium]